jgi:hypothetical protein
MQARRDDIKDSFYLYIMRSSIGSGLRDQYAPIEHLPDRLAELLRELDGSENQINEEERSHCRHDGNTWEKGKRS